MGGSDNKGDGLASQPLGPKKRPGKWGPSEGGGGRGTPASNFLRGTNFCRKKIATILTPR